MDTVADPVAMELFSGLKMVTMNASSFSVSISPATRTDMVFVLSPFANSIVPDANTEP